MKIIKIFPYIPWQNTEEELKELIKYLDENNWDYIEIER